MDETPINLSDSDFDPPESEGEFEYEFILLKPSESYHKKAYETLILANVSLISAETEMENMCGILNIEYDNKTYTIAKLFKGSPSLDLNLEISFQQQARLVSAGNRPISITSVSKRMLDIYS